ncbi:MAG: ABC transporter permease, partial [Thermoprotei archaeon]
MNWFAKRAILALITILVAASLTFFVVRSMPGDPVDALTQEFMRQYYMNYDEARSLAESVVPYLPKGTILEQYIQYMKNFLTGNLGVSISYSTGTPVLELLASRIPWTVLVVATSLIISFLIGIAIGMVMAYKHGGKLDSA